MSCVYLPLKRRRDMGLEHDADLNKLKEDLQREKERLEKLEKEVKEKMKQQTQNAWPRRQGRWRIWPSCMHLKLTCPFLFGGKLWGKMANVLPCIWPRCICSQASRLLSWMSSFVLFSPSSLYVTALMLIKSFKQKHWKVPQVIMASV